MSTFVDYYFNSDKGLQELSDEINECLGTNLTVSRPHQKEQSWCVFFGMSMDFWAHPDDDDDGLLDLEKKYKYKLGLVGPREFRGMRIPLLGMVAYLLYHRLGIGSGAIVYELEFPLATYETRMFEYNGESFEDLFDIISGKQMEMPGHLIDLASIEKD